MIIQTLKLTEQTYSTDKLVSGTTIYFPPSVLKTNRNHLEALFLDRIIIFNFIFSCTYISKLKNNVFLIIDTLNK